MTSSDPYIEMEDTLKARVKVARSTLSAIRVSLAELVFLLHDRNFSPNQSVDRDAHGNPWGFYRGCKIFVNPVLDPDKVFDTTERVTSFLAVLTEDK